MATEEGKQLVLSVTLSDGNNVKYIVKLPQADKLEVAKEATSKEKVSSWEMERLGTALSTGDNPLPLGHRTEDFPLEFATGCNRITLRAPIGALRDRPVQWFRSLTNDRSPFKKFQPFNRFALFKSLSA